MCVYGQKKLIYFFKSTNICLLFKSVINVKPNYKKNTDNSAT